MIKKKKVKIAHPTGFIPLFLASVATQNAPNPPSINPIKAPML